MSHRTNLIQRYAHIAVASTIFVGPGKINDVVAVKISSNQRIRLQSDLEIDGGLEVPSPIAQQHADCSRIEAEWVRVRHRQVRIPVSIEVCGDDRSGINTNDVIRCVLESAISVAAQ